MTVIKADIPRVSLEYAEHLSKVFSTKEIKPGTTIEQIMYDAAIRKVLDYVNRSVQGTQIIGDPDEVHIVNDVPNKSKLYSLLNIANIYNSNKDK